MNLRTRIAAGATAAAMVSIFGLAGTAASAAPSAPDSTVAAAQAAVDLPVTGTLPDGSAFTGQLSQLAVSVVNGVPMLSGVLTGTGLPAAGVPFTTAITGATAACQILNLNIQPINLDLLGLVVNLDAVHLAATQSRELATCSATCCVPSPGRLTLELFLRRSLRRSSRS
jgi:hypothetical protein